MLKLLRRLGARQVLRCSKNVISQSQLRGLADTPKSDQTSKQVVVQGAAGEDRVRVRRARPADTPRVLRFVREHARAWPGHAARASPAGNLVLCDYVARALAQGHSMLAEQQSARRDSRLRGLALSGSVCAWDARVLESYARCVRGARGKRLLAFAAHCLRAPALHHKYKLHKMLQVFLIVPPNMPNSAEIVQLLAKNAIQRGRDVGFQMLRFDVTSEDLVKSLEPLQLRKEWHLAYEVLPEGLYAIKEMEGIIQTSKPAADQETKRHFVTVYSALTQTSAGAT